MLITIVVSFNANELPRITTLFVPLSTRVDKSLSLYGNKGSKPAFKMLCNLGNVSVTGKPSVDLMCDTYQICAQRNVCPHALSHSLQESFYV